MSKLYNPSVADMMSQTHLGTEQAAPSSDGERTAAVRWFWVFLIAHVLLWTVVPILVLPNAPLDTIEMLYWGQEWEWGYYKHPPLPAWTAELSCAAFGTSVWPTYLVSQLCTAAAFWAVFRLGLSLVTPWRALAATVLLEASYYFNFKTPELNNNIFSRLWWALAILFLYQATTSNKKRYWAALGLSLGAAVLSKYDVVFLIGAMLVYSVWDPLARSRWKSVGPLLAVAAALVVAGPHLHWLAQHDFPTIRYALDRSSGGGGGWTRHITNPIGFFASQLGVIIPILVLAWPILRWRFGAQRQEPSSDRFLLAMLCLPVIFIMLLSAVTGAHIRSMWGFPLWTYLPLTVIYFLPKQLAPQVYRRIVWRCATLSLVLAAAFIVRNLASPYLRNKPSQVHFPGRELADVVNDAWKTQHEGDIPILAGNWWLAGNAAFYGNTGATVYADLDSTKGDWVSDKLLHERGGVIVWQLGDAEEIYERALDPCMRFPNLELLDPIEIPYQTGAQLDPLRIQVAIIPARSDQSPTAQQGPIYQAEKPGRRLR